MKKQISVQNYSVQYSEASFWVKMKHFANTAGKEVLEKALVLYYCMRDPDTPTKAKTVIMGALGYFILPFDVVADLAPVVGFSDDLGALILAFSIVVAHIKPKHKEQASEQLEEWFGKSHDRWYTHD